MRPRTPGQERASRLHWWGGSTSCTHLWWVFGPVGSTEIVYLMFPHRAKPESSIPGPLTRSFLCSRQRRWSELGPASGKAGQSPRLGQGPGPSEPASSRRTGDGLFFLLTSVREDTPGCAATSPASSLCAGKLITQKTPTVLQGATFLKS